MILTSKPGEATSKCESIKWKYKERTAHGENQKKEPRLDVKSGWHTDLKLSLPASFHYY